MLKVISLSARSIMWLFFLYFFLHKTNAQESLYTRDKLPPIKNIQTAAEQTKLYLPLLKGKRVAIVANQTSMIGNVHLVDSLLAMKIDVKKIFAPEHGFRGNADAGEHIGNGIDSKTGLQVISLYGKHYKPTAIDLKGIDIVIYDIQDVGVRFYTYISTMHYVMEACAENNITFLVLDRPNPNGFYVDGPVLEKKYASFVGMHQVPIVYGMTIAEYANMVNEEGWLKNGVKCELKYILCNNYSHKDRFQLPVKPSPNLPTPASIYLYPSLCLFEGTIVSVGRGTDKPFEMYGHPTMKNSSYEFTPRSIEGASKNPLYEGKKCKGEYVGGAIHLYMTDTARLQLSWLINAYSNTTDKQVFFNSFFNNLAGNSSLKQQIINGQTEAEIRTTWDKNLVKFKALRKKYLLYEDFE